MSRISLLDNTSPIGGMPDGRFSRFAILATGTIRGSASELVRVRSLAVSLARTPKTCCPSLSVNATLPYPGASRTPSKFRSFSHSFSLLRSGANVLCEKARLSSTVWRLIEGVIQSRCPRMSNSEFFCRLVRVRQTRP